MPVRKKGFLFRYFDKAICVLVAVLLLGCILYAVRRAGRLGREAPVSEAEGYLNQIRTAMRNNPPAIEHDDAAAQKAIDRLTSITPLQALSDVYVWPPMPQYLPGQRVPFNQSFVVTFPKPVKRGSVRVKGDAPIVQLEEHPADGDYRKARLRSKADAGTATVVAEGADGSFICPVEVRREFGNTAYPPIGLKVVSAQSSVVLEFRPSPKVEQEGVALLRYDIHRRDWADPTGSYREVGQAAPAAAATGALSGALAGPRGFAGFGGPAFARPAAAAGQEAGTLTWADNGTKPGQKYSYKVRAVGSNTHPAEGEFTDAVVADVAPAVDFRFTRITGDRVGFEVIRQFAVGIKKDTFWVIPGQEIGGLVEEDGQKLNYATGIVLLDFHRGVLQPGAGITDRVILATAEGGLETRLRNQTKSDLWKLEEEGGRALGAARGMPPGVAVPGIGGPRGPSGAGSRGPASGGRRGPTGGGRRGPTSGGRRR